MTATCILTVNGGSSSIRCGVYVITADGGLRLSSLFKIDRLHQNARLTVTSIDGAITETELGHINTAAAMNILFASLEKVAQINAVGHRIVHGMHHSQPQLITPQLRNELQQLAALDPEHLPFEIELADACKQRFPGIPHLACFDTAFHRHMPDVARTLPLPLRYREAGIERYGFHGLSYSYLLEELERIDEPAARSGRVIIAHLGNGASLAAVRNGICMDTSMSFSPASGIMMSTRSGDMDPGVLYHLSKTQKLNADEVQQLLNHDSGMLGVSGLSGDIRELLDAQHDNVRAALAIDMFCYQVRKCIGAYAAALGDVDTLIFSGGIGENASEIRARICNELQFIGIHVDQQQNAVNAAVISTPTSIPVRVMRTNEEWMIAKSVLRLLNQE